jgi:hypothetical protein
MVDAVTMGVRVRGRVVSIWYNFNGSDDFQIVQILKILYRILFGVRPSLSLP